MYGKKKNNAVNLEVCAVPRKAIAVALAACFSGTAIANPTGGTVVHGSAQITNPAVNVLNINTLTPKTIINWNGFSIGASELTRITQPTALSAVLNRVVGSDPSSILGALQSNGRVFLLNPNGIVFGAGSQINVAGLVASTLKLSDADFLAGRMNFTNGIGAGAVVNQGSINAAGGPVYLVGNSVTNNGIITNPNGEVVLAAGNSVELVNPGTPNLRVEIVAPDNAAKNLGSISAEAGRIGIYAGLIQQGGTVNASSAVVEGGRILLKATKNTTLDAGSQTTASGTTGGKVEIQSGDTTLSSGTIEAKGSSGAGGSVQVLGNKVGLLGNASIDASGDTGGGTVLVGGDFQGKNADVQNAFRSFVGQDVSIKADAVTQGDGGKVIIWADDITRFYGDISARGGANSGNGGFVEVSGKHLLDFQGNVNTLAPKGKIGTLLLDPDFIEVVASGGTVGLTNVDQFADGGSANYTINASTINGSATTVVLQANENIDVNAPISMITAGAGVTMQAGGYLNVQSSITTKGGAITLVAGDPGSLTLPSEGSLNVNAALDTTAGGTFPLGANITLTSNTADVGGNSVFINANITAAEFSSLASSTSTVSITGFGIDQTAGKSIQSNGLTLTGLNATSDAILLGTQTVANFSASGLRDLSFTRSTGAYTINGISVTGDLTIGGTLSLPFLTGNIAFGSGSIFNITPHLTQNSAGTRSIAGGVFQSTNNLEITTGQLDLNTTSNTLAGLIVSGGTLTNTGPTAVSGSVFFGGGTFSGAGSFTTGAGSAITMPASGAILSGKNWINSGTVTITGAGRLLLDGGAALNNQSPGVINIDSTSTATNPIFFSAGTNTFSNSGTLNKNSAAAQTLNVNGTINNLGTIHVAAGQLDLANNGTHTGTFDIDPGTALRFTGGTHNLNAGVSFTDTGALHVAGATVNVNTGLTLGPANPSLNVTSGTLSAGSNIALNNHFFWSGGTISGSGVLTTTSTTDIAGSAPILSSKVWNNTGTIEIGGSDRLTLAGAATLNNQLGGLIELKGSNANPIYWSTGGNTLNNAGTIDKLTGVGAQTLDIGGTINNTGALHVTDGQLNVANGGTHTGSFEAHAGASLNFTGGTHNLNSGATTTGPGAMAVTAGTVNFNAGSSHGSLLTTSLSAGTLNFSTGGTVDILDLVQSGGTISGSSPINVTNTYLWQSGTMTGSGALTTGGGVVTTVGSNSVVFDQRTWNNAGTININGNGQIWLNNAATLNNQSGGQVTLAGTATNPIWYSSTGGNTVNNAGTLTKTSVGGQSLNPFGTFNNTGTVQINAGQLSLVDSGTHTGTFDVGSTATLNFSGGTHDLNSGASVTGLGTLAQSGSGTVNFNAGSSIDSSLAGLSHSNGTMNIGSGVVTALATLTKGSGTLTISTGGTVSVTDLTQTGGTITGSSPIDVTNQYQWSGGTLSGTGKLTTGSGVNTIVGGSSVVFDQRVWDNAGTISINGNGQIWLNNGATLNNLSGGQMTLAGTATNPIWWSSTGGNTFNNAGTLTKTTATNQNIDPFGAFNNTGTLQVNLGQLTLNNNGTHTGTFDVSSTATLNFGGGTHNMNSGANVIGTGAMAQNSGVVNFNAGSAINSSLANVNHSSGTLNLSTGGGVTLTAMSQSGGVLTGSSDLTVSALTLGGGTISGSGLLSTPAASVTNVSSGGTVLQGRTWENEGTVNIAGTADVRLDSGATLRNLAGGQINLTGTASNPLWWSSTGGNTLDNAGAITKTSAGTQTLDVFGTVLNTGSLNVQGGTLAVVGMSDNQGTINLSPSTTFQKTGGFINSGTIQGTGTVVVGAGNTLTNNGTIRPGTSPGLLAVTGNLTLGSGSVLDIEINGTTRGTQYDAIDVTGNVTLGGTMNVGYGAFTPAAGNQFSIIQAGGTVGGTFATLNDPNALTPQITAGPAGIFKLGVFTGSLTWDGGASTLNWLDALNWSGDFVPTSANDVVIGTGVGTVLVSGVAEAKSLTSGSPLTLSSGSLTLTNPSQVNDLFTISGGSLLGSGSVVIGGSSGALAWSGGAMGAGGLFTLGAGRSGSLSGTLSLNRTFQNNGILDLSSATIGGSGSIVNAGTANFLSGAVNVNLPFSATGLTTINSGATAAFNSGSPVNLFNVNMNGGAIQGNDSVVVGGVMNLTGGTFGGSGTLSTTPGSTTHVGAPVALAGGKTWNNSGTVNIGGTGTIDLGDATPAVFNNQPGATVNITSTAGWSFISDPIAQAGQINNAGTIHVNENTSWEAAFNNAAGSALQIAGGKVLSMQNGQNISGSLNIGPGGTLWVSERHGVDTVFNNTVIGGNGTLQVLGGNPVAKFTNVAAPGVTLRLGSNGQIGIVNGSSSFAGLTLDSPGFGTAFSMSDGVFAQTTGNLTVPSGSSYGGSNNIYVAQAGDLIVPGVVSASPGSSMTLAAPAGNVKIVGGSVMADVINLFGSNITVGDSSASAPSQVVAGSALTVQTQGTLKILGGLGTGASALVSSSGALSVSTDGDVILAGGSGAGAWAKLSGNPDVVLAMVGGAVRMDAGSGSGAYAAIESVSASTILADFPFLSSGGYFVNGVEGVVYDAATGTGFIAGGSPAVLNSNLLVTYGIAGGGLSGSLEDALEVPTQTLIVATNESTKPPEAEKEKNVFNEDKKEKKKEAPVCK